MKPTLLVLAAGMGSRYGGLKQMDGLGPSGETIIDYSIYDAVQSGFGKIVYIVREYFREEFENLVHEKYAGLKCPDGKPVEFAFVTQELDKIPAGYAVNPDREKPWGTAHAVLMAKDVIKEPFAVINGDDYYGKESFRILGDWLSNNAKSNGKYCIVGFKLANTLSESGAVSRGICFYNEKNELTDIIEHLNIAKADDGIVYGDNSTTGEEHITLNAESLCSMNMWGFSADYFERSECLFKEFLSKYGTELKKECYIPFLVNEMTHNDGVNCQILSTPSSWFGVTYKEDRPAVVAKFAALVKEGAYPTPLY